MYERLWEIHVQAGVLVATAFSDILCSGAPRCCDAPDLTWPMSSEWQNRLTSHSKHIRISNLGFSAALNSLQTRVRCAFLQFQVCYLCLLHISMCMCVRMCVCVSVRGSAAQAKGPWDISGIWRAEVHLARHFGGLGRGLVHVAVGRAVHGTSCVGAAALVVGRVAAAAAALVGVRAGAVPLAGVGTRAVAVEGGDAGAGGGAGANQAGHAGRRHWGERRRRRRRI